MATRKKETRLKASEISAYCRSLAMILGSGISCEEAVVMLCDTKDEKTGIVAELIRSQFTYCLSDALKAADVFPRYMVGMVEAGETAGRLEQVLEGLGAYYDNLANIQNRIKSAIAYPAVALFVLSILLLLLAVRVLPVFSDVYASLSGMVSGDLYLSFASAAAWVIFGIAAILTIVVGIFAVMWRSGRQRKRAIAAMRRFPYFAKCIREMELASFTSAYSIYIAGAADTEQSFDAASALVEDRKLKEELRRCRGKIAEGISFSRAAMEEELYPPLYGRMLLNGERAGKGEESIFYLADKEWEQAEERLDAAIRGIEPILSIVITACVGILLITMMLPLISMMNAIG